MQHYVVRAVLYISRLQEMERGVPQVAGLFHCLGVLRAHVDGAYSCGKMLQWERCFGPPSDVCYLLKEVLKVAASYFHEAAQSPLTSPGLHELARAAASLQRGQRFTDRCFQQSSQASSASWGQVQANVALKLRQCVDTSARSALELFILWFQEQRKEDLCIRAFQNGVARFAFGGVTVQVQPSRGLSVYQILPYEMKPSVDPELAAIVRKYLVSYYAGNKGAEMLERALEALAFLGVGDGLDKILVIKDVGRKGKTARGVLRKTVFGSRSSQCSATILTTEEEARKQLS